MKKIFFPLLYIMLSFVFLPASAQDITLNNTQAQVYFSPGENSFKRIVEMINQSKSSIELQAYHFNSGLIADALINAKKRGVNVQMIIDSKNTDKKRASITLHRLALTIPIRIDNYVRHADDEVIIIDGKNVIMGSVKFTDSAVYGNAQHLFIIENEQVAGMFHANFQERLNKSAPIEAYCSTARSHRYCRNS